MGATGVGESVRVRGGVVLSLKGTVLDGSGSAVNYASGGWGGSGKGAGVSLRVPRPVLCASQCRHSGPVWKWGWGMCIKHLDVSMLSLASDLRCLCLPSTGICMSKPPCLAESP